MLKKFILLFSVLVLVGCDDTSYKHNNQKAFIITGYENNYNDECVAITGYTYPREDTISVENTFIIKCGMTPYQATEYLQQLQSSLDYQPK